MDTDLQSVQEARDLVAKAARAQELLNHFTQKQVDDICAAMAEAGCREAERLGKLAVEETRLGRVESKKIKNEFVTRDLWEEMKGLKTVGIIRRDDQRMVFEIGEPMGVVAAIVPTTNPTSTALYKSLIALKARNAIVISPHPRAVECTNEAARVVHEAAVRAGAPDGCIGCMKSVTLEGAQALMTHPKTAVILSTGGEAIVRAAYSSGKPSYGVGPGNAPAFIDRTADVRHAVRCLVDSKTFDYGTVCASEQSVVVEEGVAEDVRNEFRRQKAYFVTPEEKGKLEPVVIRGGLMNPEVVGRPAAAIARMAGFEVPEETTVLLVEMDRVGPEEPCSREILAPVLGFYVETDWKRACERCIEILRFGGMGHTLAVHSRDSQTIMEFALKKPAYRLVVNTGTSLGAIGATTGLFPSLSLGCGTSGNNISADNIGPMNLINVKRLAFDMAGDEWATKARVDEGVVTDFVPFRPIPPEGAKADGPEPGPAGGYSDAEVEQMILYNGRRRTLRSL